MLLIIKIMIKSKLVKRIISHTVLYVHIEAITLCEIMRGTMSCVAENLRLAINKEIKVGFW